MNPYASQGGHSVVHISSSICRFWRDIWRASRCHKNSLSVEQFSAPIIGTSDDESGSLNTFTEQENIVPCFER